MNYGEALPPRKNVYSDTWLSTLVTLDAMPCAIFHTFKYLKKILQATCNEPSPGKALCIFLHSFNENLSAWHRFKSKAARRLGDASGSNVTIFGLACIFACGLQSKITTWLDYTRPMSWLEVWVFRCFGTVAFPTPRSTQNQSPRCTWHGPQCV
jgi:hypothetical protein